MFEQGQNTQTKFLGLSLLEKAARFQWGSFNTQQRAAMKKYVVDKVVSIASNEAMFSDHSSYLLLNKLNSVLIEIVKREWPQDWPGFIPDIISASNASETLCQNNMRLLTMLSEEVFDFSAGTVVSHRIDELKGALNEQFLAIFQLCDAVLGRTQRKSLLVQTLDTLRAYMTWIPVEYIMKTSLLTTLCSKYLPDPAYRVATLQCLTEVATLTDKEYNEVFLQLIQSVMGQVMQSIPRGTNLGAAYAEAIDSGDEAAEHFIYHFGLFLTQFFRHHLELVEQPQTKDALAAGMGYLVSLSSVHEDEEMFKVCLDFWQWFTQSLHNADVVSLASAPMQLGGNNASGSLFGGGLSVLGGGGGSGLGSSGLGMGGGLSGLPASRQAATGAAAASSSSSRKALYSDVLTRLRSLMIEHMVKPAEVLVQEDASGNIVPSRETGEETLTLHHQLKETLVYLTHLDKEDMTGIVLGKLQRLMDESEWSFENINKLCWAIGAITRTMEAKEERRYLTKVISDLLKLTKQKQGRNNKAVVASNVMYVVGQYPRFLKAHWVFLKTVVAKLFEFMHEEHPGVKDMAVDTFVTIATRCKKQFVCPQRVERGGQVTVEDPFITVLPGMLSDTIRDLSGHQVLLFFEAAGIMISAEPTSSKQEEYTAKLMELVNQSWLGIVDSASGGLDSLRDPQKLKELARIYSINARVAGAVGPAYSKQLGTIFSDMLSMYSAMSRFTLEALNSQGEIAATTSGVKLYRSVRVAILGTLTEYIAKAKDSKFVVETFVTRLAEPILAEYQSSPACVREHQVLSLVRTIIKSCKSVLSGTAVSLLSYVFEPTLTMITANFEDHLDHRVGFFHLLETITEHAFASLMSLPVDAQKLLMNSIIWAFKHTDRQVSDTGLATLKLFLTALEQHPKSSEVAQPVYAASFMDLLQDLLRVLTDRMHKTQLAEHSSLIQHLLALAVNGRVTVPLWNSVQGASAPQDGSNTTFIQQFLAHILQQSFPNLGGETSAAFVRSLLSTTASAEAYREAIRDFLIRMLEFSADANSAELYSDRQQAMQTQSASAMAQQHAVTPGLAPLPEDDDDDL